MQESSIELKFSESVLFEEEVNIIEQPLQRTEQWHNQRKGSWTGSMIKNLMSCSSKGARLPWNANEKIYMFGTGAIKYIYEIAMQRKTDKYIVSKPTLEMKYGTAVEPLIFNIAKKELEKDGKKVYEVPYVEFPDFPKAGASSDGCLKDSKGKVLSSLELKACCSWGSHFERTFEMMDDKSIDFWQTQMQMIVWNCDTTIYAVVEPVSDIYKYLNAENILDLQTDFENETKVKFQTIEKSELHTNAIMQRIIIAETVIERFLEEENANLRQIFYEVIAEYKNGIKAAPIEPVAPITQKLVFPITPIEEVDLPF